ncbi:hypothetical protein JT06_00625 [Desulfobulbus sp. Tol-SR]|nr:hypothetical protein JT06_00625 [Desulfobulbus sp. Tol-SR]
MGKGTVLVESDRMGHAGGTETVVDIDHRQPRSTAVEHARERGDTDVVDSGDGIVQTLSGYGGLLCYWPI